MVFQRYPSHGQISSHLTPLVPRDNHIARQEGTLRHGQTRLLQNFLWLQFWFIHIPTASLLESLAARWLLFMHFHHLFSHSAPRLLSFMGGLRFELCDSVLFYFSSS